MNKISSSSLVLLSLAVGCGAPAASSDAGGLADAGAAHGGVLQASSLQVGGLTSSTVVGFFADVDLASLEVSDLPGCTRVQSGACVAVSCAGASPVAASAGTITLGVGSATPQTLMPSASSTYSATIGAFDEGAMISASASGATVPAFSADVVAPAAPVATLPTSVSMATPLTVTWTTAGAPAHVTLVLSPGSGGRANVACPVSGADGTVTVDPSVLAALGVGPAVVVLAGVETTTTRAGDYDVALRATRGTGVSATITP